MMLSPRRRVPRTSVRRGFSLVEMMVSGVLIASVATMLIPSLVSTWKQRDQIRQQQIAIEELSNLMEYATAAKWDNLTPEELEMLPPAERLLSDYQEPKLEITVNSPDDNSREIRLRFTWTTSRGLPAHPVTLTAWTYRQGVQP